MLIVQIDEPGLFVYPSAAAAARDIEPLYVDQVLRAVFDESGVPYQVEWVRPNRESRGLFGFFKSAVNGEYRFVPAGPAAPKALRTLLEDHLAQTHPAAVKNELERLLANLRAA